MTGFPRTMVGGVSMPRMICGSNWMMGFSHTSKAKDRLIKELFDTPKKCAAVIEVFARAGCNAFMSMTTEFAAEAVREVEQRVGEKMLWVGTPDWDKPGDFDAWKRTGEKARSLGATFCFPHQCTTDLRVDRINQCLAPDLKALLRIVREHGMVPGLSSHMPEAITCSDACDADVETYITPYNAAGFLCQVETDWIQKVIRGARRPVMTIKPLGAGRLLPPTGMAFVWSTLRDCDMVTVGTMSTYEAEEIVELSLALLEKRGANVELQATRSKRTLMK